MLILCGTDFSIHASEAASVAAILAAHLRGTLLLVHVYREKGLRIPSQAAFDVLHQRWEARLATEATRCRGLGAVVETQLLPGSPSAVLRDLAVRRRADLIVLSSLSSVPPVRWLLFRNGTTHRILVGAPCPVLLLPGQVLWPGSEVPSLPRPRFWRHVLIPVEMTAVGAETLFRGVALAQWYNAQVTVCNVLRTGRLQARYRSTRARNRRLAEAAAAFGTWLRRWKPPGVTVATALGEGRPAPSFLRLAKQQKAHLIVMGTQQFADWRRYRAAGAVSRILAATPCPILSIPQPPGGGRPAVTPIERGVGRVNNAAGIPS